MGSADFSDDMLAERYSVSRESIDRLRLYYDLLVKWQKAINIVSSASIEDAWVRHFVDSVQILPFIDGGVSKIVDLGSGGGFPGVVVAMCRPELDVSVVDSDERKMQFLKTVSRETSTPVQIYTDRVENILSNLRPDLITARGFTSLVNILDLAWSSAQRNPALQLLLLKGRRAKEEVAEAQEKFSFDCVFHQSVTDRDAYILAISNVRKLA